MLYGLCSIRLVADLALILSFPVLIARIVKKGNAGISVPTQILHLFTFLLRYSDLDGFHSLGTKIQWALASDSWWSGFSFIWTPVMKIYLLGVSGAVLLAMWYRAHKDKKSDKFTTPSITRQTITTTVKISLIYTIFSLILGYRFNYASFSWLPFNRPADTASPDLYDLVTSYFSSNDLLSINARDAMEVAWATSIYLGAIADIPQYKVFYRYTKHKIDWSLFTPLALHSCSRLIYIIHWIARYVDEKHIDPIAFGAGIIQVLVFWLFFVVTISKANDVLRDDDLDLEAQLAEYDAQRWGEEPERQALIFDVDDVEK